MPSLEGMPQAWPNEACSGHALGMAQRGMLRECLAMRGMLWALLARKDVLEACPAWTCLTGLLVAGGKYASGMAKAYPRNFERHASGMLQACPRKECLKHAFLWQEFIPKCAFCRQCLKHVQGKHCLGHS